MKRSKIDRIAVLCSGGDSSGMNPCIRAVVRSAVYYGMEVQGVLRGYQGLMQGRFVPMDARSVSNILNRGGTMLKTSRCPAFRRKTGRRRAIKQLEAADIQGLVVIGGDGSFQGAYQLMQESGLKVVGIPGTIDNDVAGTDYTIGYDTAMNVATEALDKIRDTAASHDRIFFVEVMGREAGYLALQVAVAAGAEAVLIPEVPTDLDRLTDELRRGRERGKTSSVVVVAEGDDAGGALDIAKAVEERLQVRCRTTILGHLQRGGSPTTLERVNASRLGLAAVRELRKGNSGVMVGLIGEQIRVSPLGRAWKRKRPISRELLDLNEILAT